VRQQANDKTAVLTNTARAQINDLQAMIDRYLDDDAFNAYREALERGRTEAGAKAKAQLKAAAKRARLLSPVQTRVAEPVKPAEPAAPVQPKPQPARPAPPRPTVPF
jgi:hypothetical protein